MQGKSKMGVKMNEISSNSESESLTPKRTEEEKNKLYPKHPRQQEKAEVHAFEEDQAAGCLRRICLNIGPRYRRSWPTLGLRLAIILDDLAIFGVAKDCTLSQCRMESEQKIHVLPHAKKGT